MLRRVRDFAEARADRVITRDVAKLALEVCDVGELGLDWAVTSPLTRSLGGGPAEVSTPAVAARGGGRHYRSRPPLWRRRAHLSGAGRHDRAHATPQGWTQLGMAPPPRATGLGQPGLFE